MYIIVIMLVLKIFQTLLTSFLHKTFPNYYIARFPKTMPSSPLGQYLTDPLRDQNLFILFTLYHVK